MATTKVTSGGITDATIATADIANGAVSASKIADDAVTAAKLATDAVISSNIVNGNVTSPKIADDAVTSAKIADSAVLAEHVAAAAVNESKLHISNSPTNGYFLSAQSGNAGGLTWAQVNTELVGDTSPQLGGDLQTNGNHIGFLDNNIARFGNGNDLDIYHSGSHSYLQNKTGNFYITAKSDEDGIIIRPDSSVELYHNNSKKLETQTNGIKAFGAISADNYYGRNLLDNGQFNIFQRQSNPTVNAGSNFYGIDRWYGRGESSAAVFTIQQLGHGSLRSYGSKYAMKATFTTGATVNSGDVYKMAQRVEGFKCYNLGWGTAYAKPVTLSFLVRTGTTGTHSGSIMNQQQNRSYPFTYSVGSTSWNEITVTIPGDTSGTWDSATGIGLEVNFDLGSGSGKRASAGSWYAGRAEGATGALQLAATQDTYFEIAKVQLEIGYMKTEYEHKSFDQDLYECQRYFCKSYDHDTVPGTATTAGAFVHTLASSYNYAGFPIIYPNTMRATPTVVLYSTVTANTTGKTTGDSGNGNASVGYNGSKRGFVFRNNDNNGLGTNVFLRAQFTASADL